MGRAKPEHAKEWAELIDKHCDGGLDDEEEEERLLEISIEPEESLNAPCVGRDKAADDYVLRQKPADSTETDAEFLAEMKGHYVLELAPKTDGLPSRTVGQLSSEVGLTSFRGEMLRDCGRVLAKAEQSLAWTHMRPDEAVEYGETLLAAAERARRGELQPEEPRPADPPPKKRFLGLLKTPPVLPSFAQQEWDRRRRGAMSIEEQIDCVEEAGRWYLFWGSRGHPIHAYF